MEDYHPAASTFRTTFSNALRFYQAGRYDAALVGLNEALPCSNSSNSYLVYDSRATVFAKLGQNKNALEDARSTIRVAPERWQGYARAARLFLKCNKIDASMTMVTMALERLGEENTERRGSLLSLQTDLRNVQKQADIRRSDQFSKLPVEIFGEIARIVIQEDPTLLLPLSHVSRQWRYAIRDHPALWNVLVLSRRRPKEKASLWIERSKGAIRELHVQLSALDARGWLGDGLQRLKWEHLRICKIQKWDIMAYLRSISKPKALANLEQLEVDDIELKHCLIRDPMFNQDLNLRYLSMSYTQVNFEKLTKHVTNLTCLTLRYTSSNGELTAFLVANTLLESLVLHYVGEDTVTTTIEQFTMPRLSSLEIRGIAPRPIFDCRMPALRILRFDSLALPLDSVLKKLVNESDIHLEELVLRSCRFVDSQPVLLLLQNSPDLHFLEVSNIAYQATSIIEALAASFPTSDPSPILRGPVDPSPDIPVLCPYLTSVDFSRCPDVKTGSLVRLVKSRLPLEDLPASHQELVNRQPPDVKRIVSLAMDCCPLVDADFLSWFRQKVDNVNCVYIKKRQAAYKGWAKSLDGRFSMIPIYILFFCNVFGHSHMYFGQLLHRCHAKFAEFLMNLDTVTPPYKNKFAWILLSFTPCHRFMVTMPLEYFSQQDIETFSVLILRQDDSQ